MRSVFLVALALMLLCAPVAPAAAETATQTKLSALASFSVLAKKRCVAVTVSITAWDVREGDGSGPRVANPPFDQTDPPAIYVAISKENQCTGELLVSGSEEIFYADDEFFESPSLTQASLDVVFTLENDVDGASVPISLTVQFRGVGPLSHDASDSNGSLGQQRAATARGVIVIGSETLTLRRTSDASLLLYQYQV
jgi:hypothetical protein